MNALRPIDWLGEVPAMRDEFAPPLSVQLLDAGRILAERLTGGEFAALETEQRADLRGLSLTMIAWSEQAQRLQERLADAQLRETGWLPRRSRLRRWFRRFGRG